MIRKWLFKKVITFPVVFVISFSKNSEIPLKNGANVKKLTKKKEKIIFVICHKKTEMYEKKYSFLYLQNEGSLLNLIAKRSIINHN